MERRIMTRRQLKRTKQIYHTAFNAAVMALRIVFLLVICTSCYDREWGFVIFSIPVLGVLLSPLVEKTWVSFWKEISKGFIIDAR